MLRSMYAGISGMKNFQTKLDVIGNNIANVNTSGFKKGRVTFQDMMAQTTTATQPATTTRGGINAAQVGLGSQLGSIDNIHTQGFRQTTNNPLDFALEGDGFFVLAEGIDTSDTDYESNDSVSIDINEEDAQFSYSRAGNFYLDSNGNIVNSQGYYLVGFQAAGDGEIDVSNENLGTIHIPDSAKSFSVLSNGTVNYINNEGEREIAGQLALANFSNPAGLEKVGSNMFVNSENAGGNVTENGIPEFVAAQSDDLATSIFSGALEMSNVDLAEEFTEMITAQRGFQANTRIITTSDQILEELVNLKR